MNRSLATVICLVALVALLPYLNARSAPTAQSSRPENASSAFPIPGDRWLEIDLYWFEQNAISASVNTFWGRFEPLFEGVQGYRGIIVNVGWTVACVMEWSGNLDQRITLPQGSGQQKWVDERGSYTGPTEERKRQFMTRFAKPQIVERRGYDAWTYGDVKKLAAALREEAGKRGITELRVGLLNYAWTDAYGEVAPWAKRHPEAFTTPRSRSGAWSPGAYFDPAARLHADPARLGGFPDGIPEGMLVHKAYAAQWGSLSKAVHLDAVMLRDSFGMPVPYERWGPYGALAPSYQAIRDSTAAVAALVREIKQANRQALVMMYSNAASAVADWRSNCMDLESIAKEGYLDIWVDQTWAGAWNEVGLRQESFWNRPTLGWTYQLNYMLLHAAILASTKVRHYPLIETFDAWESWDVIHTAPERLRWGIWAYSHAAVKTPEGLKLPAGSYISWANQGKRLLDPEDVHFLATSANAAIADARNMTEVYGPTLVYSREAMRWQAEHAVPHRDIKEWIDEQAGGVDKWPIPILSVTRVEWLPQVKSDLFILQTPSHLVPEEIAYIARMIRGGQPTAIFGSPAGGIDPGIAKLAGLSASEGAVEDQSQVRTAKTVGDVSALARGIPSTFGIYHRLTADASSGGAHVVYTIEGVPVLTLNPLSGKRVVVWDPPDLSANEDVPLRDDWGGSGAAYALAAGVLNSLLSSGGALHAEGIDLNQTMNVSAWRLRDSTYHLLAANLEEGLRDDADMTRHATMAPPGSWKAATWTDAWSHRSFDLDQGELRIDLGQAQSVLLTSSGRDKERLGRGGDCGPEHLHARGIPRERGRDFDCRRVAFPAPYFEQPTASSSTLSGVLRFPLLLQMSWPSLVRNSSVPPVKPWIDQTRIASAAAGVATTCRHVCLEMVPAFRAIASSSSAQSLSR